MVEARSGEEALASARARRPDLVIVDMMMPGRSGLEVVAALRAEAELAAVPVVMLTARAQAADERAAMLAGVDRFLAKPFSPAELVGIVRDLLAEAER